MENGLSRNIIHVMVSSNYQKPFQDLIESLYKYSKFELHLVELGNIPFYDSLSGPKKKITYNDRDWDGKRAQIRVESYLKFDYKEGDRVLSMDADMVVKEDPFRVFDLFDGDVLLSTRDHFDKMPVIACFWGFVYNDRTYNFLNYIKKQVKEKLNWKVLRDFRKRRQHTGTDWWIDQDVLCSVYQDGYKDLKIRDIGWHWSYDINHKLNRKSREGKIKRDSAKALHYKNSKKWRNLR